MASMVGARVAATTAVGAASLTGAGIGASGGAAATGAFGALSSAVPVFAIAGMAIGGGLGFLRAKSQNRLLRRQLQATYAAINSQIGENRLAFYDASRIMSSKNATELSILNLDLSGFGSGLSTAEFAAQVQADKEQDQYMLRRQANRNEANLELDKENAYNAAKAQAVNPFLGALQGALSYGSAGASLGGSIDSFRINQANNSALTQFANEYDPTSDLSIARVNAINAGVEPYKLVGGGQDNPFLQPFLVGLKQQGIQQRILQNQFTMSNIELQSALGRSAMVGNPTVKKNIYDYLFGGR